MDFRIILVFIGSHERIILIGYDSYCGEPKRDKKRDKKEWEKMKEQKCYFVTIETVHPFFALVALATNVHNLLKYLDQKAHVDI